MRKISSSYYRQHPSSLSSNTSGEQLNEDFVELHTDPSTSVTSIASPVTSYNAALANITAPPVSYSMTGLGGGHLTSAVGSLGLASVASPLVFFDSLHHAELRPRTGSHGNVIVVSGGVPAVITKGKSGSIHTMPRISESTNMAEACRRGSGNDYSRKLVAIAAGEESDYVVMETNNLGNSSNNSKVKDGGFPTDESDDYMVMCNTDVTTNNADTSDYVTMTNSDVTGETWQTESATAAGSSSAGGHKGNGFSGRKLTPVNENDSCFTAANSSSSDDLNGSQCTLSNVNAALDALRDVSIGEDGGSSRSLENASGGAKRSMGVVSYGIAGSDNSIKSSPGARHSWNHYRNPVPGENGPGAGGLNPTWPSTMSLPLCHWKSAEDRSDAPSPDCFHKVSEPSPPGVGLDYALLCNLSHPVSAVNGVGGAATFGTGLGSGIAVGTAIGSAVGGAAENPGPVVRSLSLNTPRPAMKTDTDYVQICTPLRLSRE